MNFYPFHIGDYTTHTAHLEPMEDLAYRRLLDAYYLREGSLPADIAEICRITRLRQYAKEVETVLREFFILSNEGWANDRAEKELEKFKTKSEKAKRSAEQRWSSNANAMRTHSEGNATNTNTNTNTRDIEQPSPKADSKVSPPDGVSIQVWADFIKHRRVLKAPITDTAINGFRREAAKAGMSLEQALITSIENNWRGFKAEWIKTPQTSTLMKGVL